MGDSWLLRNARLGIGGGLADIAVVDGHVVEIAAEPQGHGDAQQIDLDGRTVLPGLWDSHVHSTQWALRQRSLDVSAATSAQEVADLVAARIRSEDEQHSVLYAYGAREAGWDDAPSRELLAGEDRPVAIQSHDLHFAWLNRPALRLIGAAEHPTGLLREQDCFSAVAELPRPSAEQIDTWIHESMRAAAARGVTGILDFEMADNVADWRRRGEAAVRVSCSVPRPMLQDAIERGLQTGARVPGAMTATVGPVKVFADGTLSSQNAYCCEPYPARSGSTETYGSEETDLEELAGLMRSASGAGLEVAVHAIGDHSTQVALDAFERTGCRGRVEHAQLVRATDASRFGRLDLVVGVQPAHVHDDRDLADAAWVGRTDRAFAYRTLLDAGSRLEFGSDAPVSALDPWRGIAAAVDRTLDERPGWHDEQSLTLDEALAASARGRRHLGVGDAADLVVIDDDLARIPGRQLARTSVFATMMDGRWTYRQ